MSNKLKEDKSRPLDYLDARRALTCSKGIIVSFVVMLIIITPVCLYISYKNTNDVSSMYIAILEAIKQLVGLYLGKTVVENLGQAVFGDKDTTKNIFDVLKEKPKSSSEQIEIEDVEL